MPIEIKNTVEASYSLAEIKKLIIDDLSRKGVKNVRPDSVSVSISGGTMYDANASYSGGGGPDYKCDPVVFNGVNVYQEDKHANPVTRAGA